MKEIFIVYSGTDWESSPYVFPEVAAVCKSFKKAMELVADNSEIPYEWFFGYDAPMSHTEEEYRKAIIKELKKNNCVHSDDYWYRIEAVPVNEWVDR